MSAAGNRAAPLQQEGRQHQHQHHQRQLQQQHGGSSGPEKALSPQRQRRPLMSSHVPSGRAPACAEGPISPPPARGGSPYAHAAGDGGSGAAAALHAMASMPLLGGGEGDEMPASARLAFHVDLEDLDAELAKLEQRRRQPQQGGDRVRASAAAPHDPGGAPQPQPLPHTQRRRQVEGTAVFYPDIGVGRLLAKLAPGEGAHAEHSSGGGAGGLIRAGWNGELEASLDLDEEARAAPVQPHYAGASSPASTCAAIAPASAAAHPGPVLPDSPGAAGSPDGPEYWRALSRCTADRASVGTPGGGAWGVHVGSAGLRCVEGAADEINMSLSALWQELEIVKQTLDDEGQAAAAARASGGGDCGGGGDGGGGGCGGSGVAGASHLLSSQQAEPAGCGPWHVDGGPHTEGADEPLASASAFQLYQAALREEEEAAVARAAEPGHDSGGDEGMAAAEQWQQHVQLSAAACDSPNRLFYHQPTLPLQPGLHSLLQQLPICQQQPHPLQQQQQQQQQKLDPLQQHQQLQQQPHHQWSAAPQPQWLPPSPPLLPPPQQQRPISVGAEVAAPIIGRAVRNVLEVRGRAEGVAKWGVLHKSFN
jgi:hypothetical protein